MNPDFKCKNLECLLKFCAKRNGVRKRDDVLKRLFMNVLQNDLEISEELASEVSNGDVTQLVAAMKKFEVAGKELNRIMRKVAKNSPKS